MDTSSPPGWRSVDNGLMREWFPLDFPRVRAVITLFPAMPQRGPIESALADLFGGGRAHSFVQHARHGPTPASFAGMVGQEWRIEGEYPHEPRCELVALFLRDGRYHYTLLLEHPPGDPDRTLEVLRAIARALVPIPAPSLGDISNPWSD